MATETGGLDNLSDAQQRLLKCFCSKCSVKPAHVDAGRNDDDSPVLYDDIMETTAAERLQHPFEKSKDSGLPTSEIMMASVRNDDVTKEVELKNERIKSDLKKAKLARQANTKRRRTIVESDSSGSEV